MLLNYPCLYDEDMIYYFLDHAFNQLSMCVHLAKLPLNSMLITSRCCYQMRTLNVYLIIWIIVVIVRNYVVWSNNLVFSISFCSIKSVNRYVYFNACQTVVSDIGLMNLNVSFVLPIDEISCLHVFFTWGLLIREGTENKMPTGIKNLPKNHKFIQQAIGVFIHTDLLIR